MESSSTEPTISKKILHILRAVYCMIRKGITSKRRLMDLHLLLKRWKAAGKAVGSPGAAYHSFSCKSMDPAHSFFSPRHVEFSCSNTPAYAPSHLGRRKAHRRGPYDYEAVAAIARAFEMLNSNTPSPMPAGLGRSPMTVRRVRITDSPFPIKEDGVADDGMVDKEAEEFIKRFYEQLKIQQKTAVATPEYMLRRG